MFLHCVITALLVFLLDFFDVPHPAITPAVRMAAQTHAASSRRPIPLPNLSDFTDLSLPLVTQPSREAKFANVTASTSAPPLKTSVTQSAAPASCRPVVP